MRINGVGEIGDYTRNIATGALRGFYITKVPMGSSITTMCILAIPLSYLLGFVADWGMEGVYAGRAFGMILGGFIMLMLWLGVSNYKVYFRASAKADAVSPITPVIQVDDEEVRPILSQLDVTAAPESTNGIMAQVYALNNWAWGRFWVGEPGSVPPSERELASQTFSDP